MVMIIIMFVVVMIAMIGGLVGTSGGVSALVLAVIHHRISNDGSLSKRRPYREREGGGV